MATNTYYSPFFPATEVVGTKGTTIAVVPSAVVGGVQDEINKINDKLEDYQGGGTVDTTPPGPVTNLAVSSNITDNGAEMLITWTPPSDDDLAGFDVAVAEGAGTFIRFTTSGFTYKLSSLRRNQLYKVQVRAFDRVANPGPWTNIIEHTTARDTVPPGPVSDVKVDTTFNTVFLNWRNPEDADLARVEVRLVDSNSTIIKTTSVSAEPSTRGSVIFTGLNKGSTFSAYIFAYDTSENESSSVNTGNFSTVSGVNLNDFTPGLQPTQTVNGLPSPVGYTGPSLVFNQADGKLYRYTAGVFEVRTNGADIIDGTLTANKIAAGTITAAQVAAGALTANVLAIGDSSNLIPDSLITSYNTWIKGVGAPVYTIVPGSGSYAGNYILIPYSAEEQQVFSLPIPVTQNEQYYVSGILDSTSNSGGGQARLHITWYNDTAATSRISDTVIGVNSTGWSGGRTTATVTAPTNAKSARYIFSRLSGGSTNSNFAEAIFKPVLGGTLIKDGAITTDKITVGTLNGDRIATGTLDADKIKANSILAGTIKVGGTDLSTIQQSAINSSATTWFSSTPGVYTTTGNRVTKTGGGNNLWDSNAYTTNPIFNGCMIKGRLATNAVFLGLTAGTPAGHYSVIDYSWHRSDDGTVSVWIRDQRLQVWQQSEIPPDTTDFSIVYDGKQVRWYSNGEQRWSILAVSDQPFWGTITSAFTGRYVDRLSFAPAADNSLNRADPALRINQATTTIDPGKILISGGITLADWRQGGDSTKIAGGAISTNTITANKLTVGNRAISAMGIDFRYDRNDGRLYWGSGYIFVNDDNNTPMAYPISGGSTAWGGGFTYVYWSKGSSGLASTTQWSTILSNPDGVIIATWYDGGSGFLANFGSTIVDGDRITTGSIDANRIKANTILASTVQVSGYGPLSDVANNASTGAQDPASRINSNTTTINGGKITTNSISADKLNIGPSSGARLSLEYNTIKVFDANTKRVQLGNLDL